MPLQSSSDLASASNPTFAVFDDPLLLRRGLTKAEEDELERKYKAEKQSRLAYKAAGKKMMMNLDFGLKGENMLNLIHEHSAAADKWRTAVDDLESSQNRINDKYRIP